MIACDALTGVNLPVDGGELLGLVDSLKPHAGDLLGGGSVGSGLRRGEGGGRADAGALALAPGP